MKRAFAVALALGTGAALSACDECAGTPSCHTFPQISHYGQFIERKSGRPVAGVSVRFVRRAGIDVDQDTITTTSDGDGFFTLRTGSSYSGVVTGDLLVTPPLPGKPFTVTGISMSTSAVRGDGSFLGRFVVDPYLLLVGHVRDRKTLTPLAGVTVIMRRTSGGRLEQDVHTFVTDFGGQFAWIDPVIVDPQTINVTFEVIAPGYPRTFLVPREVPLQYRDGDMAFIIIPVGSGLVYSGSTGRRVTGQQFPGATVQFRRTGGIETSPAQVTMPVDANGGFPIPIEPLGEGTVTGELIVTPPPPYPPEVFTVTMRTSDDDRNVFLGVFPYGAQAFASVTLRDAATGVPIDSGTPVSFRRVSGVALEWGETDEGHTRTVEQGGRVKYQAPTGDSGTVRFDIVVRLPEPFAWDTIPAVAVQARYSDEPFEVGPLSVRRRARP